MLQPADETQRGRAITPHTEDMLKEGSVQYGGHLLGKLRKGKTRICDNSKAVVVYKLAVVYVCFLMFTHLNSVYVFTEVLQGAKRVGRD